MSSILKVDTIQDQAGNNIINESNNVITIGASGDTITVPAGATVSGFTSAGIDDNATSVAITIDSSERVGIGTTSPANTLDVNNSAGAVIKITRDSQSSYLQLSTDGSSGQIFSGAGDLKFKTGTSEAARIDTSGNFGISTSAPKEKLDSRGSAVFSGDHATATNAYGTAHGILLSSTSNLGKITAISNGSNDVKLELRGLDGGTANSNQLVLDGGTSNVGIGTTAPDSVLNIVTNSASNGDRIRIQDGTYKLDLGVGATSFIQTIGASALKINTNATERMRITSAGDVGIGLTSPAHRLSVFDGSTGIVARFATTGNRSLDISSADNGSYAGAHWNRDVNSAGGIQSFSTEGNENMRISATGIVFNESSQDLDFRVESNNNANMLFVDGGNDRVGIGTSSPGVTFQVDTPTQNAHVTNIKMSQGGWSNSINKLKSLAWGDPNTLGAIGLLYDGSKADMKWHSFYNGGYKTETTTIMTLTGTGNLSVSGSISKGSGSFTIDHPLPSKKETHNLVHSFVEAPQADNIYRGKIDLVNGTATINIDTNSEMSDGTFVLLNREIQCFTSNETGWTAVKGSVSGNTLTITAQDNTCDDTISWMVIGERQDQHMYDTEWTDENGKVIVEPLKEIETTTP